MNKSERLHLRVDDLTDETVRRECGKRDMSQSDYITDTALTFAPNETLKKLNKTSKMLSAYAKQKEVKLKSGRKEGYMMKEIKEYRKISVQNGKTKQFHLRVTPETYEKIRKRAAEYSMSVSDYVVFITSHFDITEISQKIDEINDKIDQLNRR